VTGHWLHEIKAYASSTLKPLLYMGTAPERKRYGAGAGRSRMDPHGDGLTWPYLERRVAASRRLLPRFDEHNVVITSYDVLRNDLEALRVRPYLYCVLDEGHVIKNPRAKLTLAAKALRADHRLILTGTPIQVGRRPPPAAVGAQQPV